MEYFLEGVSEFLIPNFGDYRPKYMSYPNDTDKEKLQTEFVRYRTLQVWLLNSEVLIDYRFERKIKWIRLKTLFSNPSIYAESDKFRYRDGVYQHYWEFRSKVLLHMRRQVVNMLDSVKTETEYKNQLRILKLKDL